MSQIKDKLIGIFEVKVERDLGGNEVKVKRYIHNRNRLHAYVRETSILFRLNYNKKLRTGQYIEFRGETYIIVSIDGFEYYQRDLTVRAEKVKPEVYDYEEYTEQ